MKNFSETNKDPYNIDLIDYEKTKKLIKGKISIVLKEGLEPFKDFYFVLDPTFFTNLESI
jgi:hypothetical protein